MPDHAEAALTPIPIHDPGDPRLAPYRRLNDATHRRSIEAPGPFAPGMAVIEGWLALETALGRRASLRSVLVDERRVGRLATLLGRRRVPVLAAPAAVIADAVGFDLHRGVVAVADRPRSFDPDALVARSRRLVVVEGMNDAENLGSVVRTAAGLGADGLLADPATCDPWTRRTIRVSLGHVWSMPLARAPLSGALGRWRARGAMVVATSPRGGVDLRTVRPDRPVAVVVGAEGAGLSSELLETADVVASIPMTDGVDSLNVGAAAAIALWHLFAPR